jgi:hypothetical protein
MLGLGAWHRRRRTVATIALVGMAFYAVLVPWHTVSQAITPLLAAAEAVAPPCHDHAAMADGQQGPAKPRTNCPICKGLGTLNLATAAQAFLVLATAAESTPLPLSSDDDLVPGEDVVPQSRGPPLLSI